MDVFDQLLQDEERARDEWLDEVRRQRSNKDSGMQVSGARMHELHQELEGVRWRITEFLARSP